MPRRPAPTPLVLFQGPLPPRNQSKFTMPSMPRPIFLPPSVVTRGPATRRRAVGDNSELVYGIKGVEGSSVRADGGGKIRGPWDHSGSYATIAKTVAVVVPPKAAVGML
ncbi:hypothetical protein EI94DRAFT_39004 [Lactarius quietus]|nr:hypothetical protein EI94DRAFT_39004 [Lactarius quietus]